jgi:hypothetical protein
MYVYIYTQVGMYACTTMNPDSALFVLTEGAQREATSLSMAGLPMTHCDLDRVVTAPFASAIALALASFVRVCNNHTTQRTY